MENTIGDKNVFAITVDIIKYQPWIWGKSCLWVNNIQIGDLDDENILGPFMWSLMRIAIKNQKLWLEELEGLECREIFQTINPFYNNPEHFDNLTYEEQSKYIKYDVFQFMYGENFDNWMIDSIVKDGVCKFIWVKSKIEQDPSCFDVPLACVQEVYRQFCKLIPDQFWPSLIDKLE